MAIVGTWPLLWGEKPPNHPLFKSSVCERQPLRSKMAYKKVAFVGEELEE